MSKLLNSLEQTVFKDVSQTVTLSQKTNPLTEFEQLRRGAGSKADDFVRVMGVTVAMAYERKSKCTKPPTIKLKLTRLIQANPRLGKQLMD